VPPSPKAQENAGVPVQLAGVAVDWKLTGMPTLPVGGTVAVQLSEHPAEITMLPLFVQGTPPAVAVMDQLKVPAEE
jgi:hypothetical protein